MTTEYPHKAIRNSKICLIRPPFFTPWSPPLGISLLKSYLEQHNYSVQCLDFNVDPKLWSTHHKYFEALQAKEDISINDGYSQLWFILNAHMLAFINGADSTVCSRILKQITPFYGIRLDVQVLRTLSTTLESYFSRLQELYNQYDFSPFSVVGTSTYSSSLPSSLYLLRRIKQEYPHIKTVMGGGVFFDDLALGSENLKTLTEKYPFVDHVILGEGELLFLRLLQGTLSDRRVITIGDLKGETLNINDVPTPDFRDFDLEKYFHLTIEGGRSCPFECTFCSETVQWGLYRKKPKQLLTEQVIDLAHKHNNNRFFMGDSLMNPYIEGFSSELLKENADIFYDGYLRADKIAADKERVRRWARSGVYRVRLGIESGSARILEMMDKKTSPQTVSDVLKALANAGIRTTTYWIVGYPGETEEDFQETVSFVQENHKYIYELEAHPYYYYPYGQVASRLYNSYSLYPEEVTEVMGFKEWEIVDCQPTRQEKFDRLRRISKIATNLGLPNIYSTVERYKAEDRWFNLYPKAVEVY